MRLASQHINISVIVAYAPTEISCKTSNDNFYRLLASTQNSLPAHDIKLLLGDLNALVGQDTTSWKGIIGKHSFHQVSNDNGSRLLEHCALQELCICGTLFEHKNIHKTTWHSPDGVTRTQIDHIMISRKWRHYLLDVRACRGPDICTTHNLVVHT